MYVLYKFWIILWVSKPLAHAVVFFLWVHGCYLNYIMEYNFEIKCVGLFNIWFRIYLPCVNLKYESWHIHVHIPYPETKGNKFWTRSEIEANVELIIIS